MCAEKEAICKRAEAAKMIDSEGKQKDLLVDKVFKNSNTGAGAINLKLRSLCLMMLGGSGYRCGRSTRRRRRRRNSDVHGQKSSN